MDEHHGIEAELGSAKDTNMVDGNAFAREFREAASKLRPREIEVDDETEVSDHVRGASEALAFVAMRLAGEDRAPYDRWLEGLQQTPGEVHRAR